MLALTQLSNYLTLKGSFSAVLKPNVASKYALESSRRDLHNALLCTVLESNPQKPGKTWKEKGLAKTTSGRDDQKKPVAAASYSILQRDEWLRRKKPRGKKVPEQLRGILLLLCSFRGVGLGGRVPTDLRG